MRGGGGKGKEGREGEVEGRKTMKRGRERWRKEIQRKEREGGKDKEKGE